MIACSYIESNLDLIDKRYLKSKTNRDASYYSKLAVLELCGWIEMSIDDCIIKTANRILKDQVSKKVIDERIKRTYGFEYENHFRSLIMALIGIQGFERVERKITPATVTNFKSELGSLKTSRNSLAHTYIRGTTVTYDAPSVTRSRYAHVKTGLLEYDRVLRQLYS
jgi:hypothetical protein